MEAIKLKVPQYKYEEMSEKLGSIADLAEDKEVKDIVIFDNKEFVITGAYGTGTGKGWAKFQACRVEDLSTYKGSLKPLKVAEHRQEVDLGRRERGYSGRIILHKSRKLVICEPYEFTEDSTGKQINLF